MPLNTAGFPAFRMHSVAHVSRMFSPTFKRRAWDPIAPRVPSHWPVAPLAATPYHLGEPRAGTEPFRRPRVQPRGPDDAPRRPRPTARRAPRPSLCSSEGPSLRPRHDTGRRGAKRKSPPGGRSGAEHRAKRGGRSERGAGLLRSVRSRREASGSNLNASRRPRGQTRRTM
jgi:hypothetical protein